MDIFKLFFEHDLRLDQLRERKPGNTGAQVTMSIEDFMKPDPTYSKFYITGTRFSETPRFGLDTLLKAEMIIQALSTALSDYAVYYRGEITTLDRAIGETTFEEPLILGKEDTPISSADGLILESGMNINQKKSELAEVLEKNLLVLYKEKAHHGFDLHLFSKMNIYPALFYPFRNLTDEEFRFFSINGKRMRSERMFYFETWALDRPPHGAEEVFRSTEI
ncbi:MAG: hypothetical protein EA360_03645 [Balneolaceae bacterium]|nr:MAG: hypothetical protein EA360_03645 [Balneolaceae bacterium]